MKVRVCSVYVLALGLVSAAPDEQLPYERCGLNFRKIIDEHQISLDFYGYCVLPGDPGDCTPGVWFGVHCWNRIKNHAILRPGLRMLTSGRSTQMMLSLLAAWTE